MKKAVESGAFGNLRRFRGGLGEGLGGFRIKDDDVVQQYLLHLNLFNDFRSPQDSTL